jgi:hypothetical protein
LRLTFLSSIVSGRTEQEIKDRKQETENRKRKTEQEEGIQKRHQERIRIEAKLPVLFRLREDGTGNKK